MQIVDNIVVAKAVSWRLRSFFIRGHGSNFEGVSGVQSREPGLSDPARGSASCPPRPAHPSLPRPAPAEGFGCELRRKLGTFITPLLRQVFIRSTGIAWSFPHG